MEPERDITHQTQKPTTIPSDATITPPDEANDERQRLWEAYCEQQRRRACPGCGDVGFEL